MRKKGIKKTRTKGVYDRFATERLRKGNKSERGVLHTKGTNKREERS